nr:MAG TPA: hypothetical protein [Caudoviricetes sp.]
MSYTQKGIPNCDKAVPCQLLGNRAHLSVTGRA